MARERVQCYFLLGKLGALYSAGLYQYAADINKLVGTDVSVLDYGYWAPFTGAQNAHSSAVIERAKTRRIALFGHSMGATGISMIARDCKAAGVDVDLIFSLDCSWWSPPIPLGSNVKSTVTFCDPSHFIGGSQQVKGPGYTGKWASATTTGISHVQYDDDTRLRLRGVGEVKILLNQ